MNYKKIYDSIIDRAQSRILTDYYETHHIIPRCLGGSDNKDNLVDLTPEEHYVAHQLLIKIYPDNFKLIKAGMMMTVSSKLHKRINNKLYGWLRTKYSNQLKNKEPWNKGLTGKQTAWNKGLKLSEKSIAMKGNTNGSGNKGKIHTVESKSKMSDAFKGRTWKLIDGKRVWI